MKLLIAYFRQRWRGITAAFLFCGIFMITFALFHLPWEAIAYPALLCAVVGLLFFAMDFQRIRKRHAMLKKIQCFMDAVPENLPQIDGVEDADYQNILSLLRDEQQTRSAAAKKRYWDMVEYYTVWAHQIKTPIASMRLTLQNEDSAFSRKLSADLFRVEQYVEMVLMFLRLDSESSDYLIREYDLDSVVRQAVRKFAGEFITRKLRLIYEPVSTQVVTDEKWLSFVIEQVLSNALKYTPAGTISITLDSPKTLCIRDTGIGIAPEDLPRIFENGYTGYNGRADKKASGIGLYLCKRICGNLGHRIWVESTPDVGTTVRIDLSQKKISAE